MNRDVNILRELAKQYIEIANLPIQQTRRELWKAHNSFESARPLIYVMGFPFVYNIVKNEMRCEDPLFNQYEWELRFAIYKSRFGDDSITEPWLPISAIHETTYGMRWGFEFGLGERPSETGAAQFKPILIEEDDFSKFKVPVHKIDEEATRLVLEKMQDAIGDIVTIDLNRGPLFRVFSGDISTDITRMIGLEQFMWDVYDRPEWLHKILAFMRDGILKAHEEAEAAGDYSMTCQDIQAMPYAMELNSPAPNAYDVKRKDIWTYFAAQEFTAFSADMFDEFMLQYQLPIMEKFGLVAYGCCEDLTDKIDRLRKVPNLRRIAVTPFADVEKNAAQIGRDYIAAWRPNPSSMVCNGLDEDYVRGFMKENFEIFKRYNNVFDITLKDVETVQNKPENVTRWVQIVREEIENAFG